MNDALAEPLLREPVEPFHGGQILGKPGLENFGSARRRSSPSKRYSAASGQREDRGTAHHNLRLRSCCCGNRKDIGLDAALK